MQRKTVPMSLIWELWLTSMWDKASAHQFSHHHSQVGGDGRHTVLQIVVKLCAVLWNIDHLGRTKNKTVSVNVIRVYQTKPWCAALENGPGINMWLFRWGSDWNTHMVCFRKRTNMSSSSPLPMLSQILGQYETIVSVWIGFWVDFYLVTQVHDIVDVLLGYLGSHGDFSGEFDLGFNLLRDEIWQVCGGHVGSDTWGWGVKGHS